MVPEKSSLISSKVDLPVKQENKKNSRDEQSAVVSRVQKIEMNHCANHKLQTKSKQQQCQATVFKGKSFQAEKYVHMWPKKPAKDMWLRKPAATGKICKATKCKNTDSKSQSTVKYVCSGQKCQENNVMQSVTKKWMYIYPNQQLEDCVVTRTVNIPDGIGVQ